MDLDGSRARGGTVRGVVFFRQKNEDGGWELAFLFLSLGKVHASKEILKQRAVLLRTGQLSWFGDWHLG